MIPRLRPPTAWQEYIASIFPRHTVKDFERRFSQVFEQGHAIAFPYGRTALIALFEALGIKGKRIICPAYTCVVVAHAIVLSGNIPVFVDSAPGGFNMDLDRAETCVTEDTAALIATSIHGYPVNLDRLRALAKAKPHIKIIQDCAHSFSAEWRGEPVQRAGIAAIYGLNVSKIMTSVFGGMISTDDEGLAGRLRSWRIKNLRSSAIHSAMRCAYLLAAGAALTPQMFGLVRRIQQLGLIDRFVEYYSEELIDMPADYRVQIGRVEASVGVVQCDRYPDTIRHRRHIAAIYDDALKSYPRVERPPIVAGATYSHYVARVANPEPLLEVASANGIELGRLIDYCVPDMAAYKRFGQPDGDFVRTRALNNSVINLPLWVDEIQARRIASIVGEAA